MIEQKILPLDENPILSTFNNTAYSNSVLYAQCQNPGNWNLEHALQLVSASQENMLDFYMPFFIYWKCFKHNLLIFQPNNKKSFIKALKNKINNDYYVYLTVEGYYLPHRCAYKNCFLIYDVMVFGYDKDNFYIIGYNEEHRYKAEVVPQNDLFESFHQRPGKWKINNFYFKVKDTVLPDIDINKVIASLEDFLYPFEKDKMKLGINAYDAFLCYLQKLDNQFDMKPFKTLRDHKKLISDLIYSQLGDGELYQNYLQVKKKAENIFILVMKYNKGSTQDKKNKIIASIKELINIEIPLIKQLIDNLKYKNNCG